MADAQRECRHWLTIAGRGARATLPLAMCSDRSVSAYQSRPSAIGACSLIARHPLLECSTLAFAHGSRRHDVRGARRRRRVRHDHEIPTRLSGSSRILGDRAGARSRSQRVPAEARRPRCWPLLVSRRDGRCDPGCGRPKAAPRHPPRLNTVSVLHRHTRPLRTPIIDRDYPGVAFSALRSPAVRDPCAIRARSCAELGILMASSGQ